jgi:outer membrane protein OmpA-like peptidoglycan-associated protein
MDTFAELSPEELKLTALQFMGQHLTGDLKELNKNIVSQNRTLQGMTIDPVHVINTIPGGRIAQQPNPYANVVNAGINVQQPINSIPVQHVPEVQQHVVQTDPNQLEFDFNNSNIAKQIFDKIDVINSKLDKVIASLNNTSND